MNMIVNELLFLRTTHPHSLCLISISSYKYNLQNDHKITESKEVNRQQWTYYHRHLSQQHPCQISSSLVFGILWTEILSTLGISYWRVGLKDGEIMVGCRIVIIGGFGIQGDWILL